MPKKRKPKVYKPKNRCGGKKSGCAIVLNPNKLLEYPYAA
jgi:hypothetical protein